ncbi:MAG: PIN domain-containing protein [Alphaproteobacteria bacterium]|nr:PIN domain-containing protein [Alphaproteobacteria bacterium]
MKVALDTNILACAEGVNGPDRRRLVLDVLRRLPTDAVVVPAQALGELFNVLVRKAAWKPRDARAALLAWSDSFVTIASTTPIMHAAADLAVDHRLGIWDCVILASAAEEKCRLLLSEDLQEGFTWRGVTIVNPLATVRHDLLATLLDSPPA